MTNQWRAFLDFSTGGSLGDWLVHNLGPAHLALQLDKASPISVECVTVEGKNQWVWPLRAHTGLRIPGAANMPPVTIHAYQNMRGDFQNPPGMAEDETALPADEQPGRKGPAVRGRRRRHDAGGPATDCGRQAGGRGGGPLPGGPAGGGAAGRRAGRFSGWTAGRGGPGGPPAAAGDPTLRAPGNGSVFVGSKGYMATTSRGEGVWLLPASRWAEYKLPPQLLQRGVNHQQDWIRACKGGAPGVSEFAVASKYIEWLALGAVALRVPGKLMWDAKNLRFTNSEEANKYLKPFLRKGWELKL